MTMHADSLEPRMTTHALQLCSPLISDPSVAREPGKDLPSTMRPYGALGGPDELRRVLRIPHGTQQPPGAQPGALRSPTTPR